MTLKVNTFQYTLILILILLFSGFAVWPASAADNGMIKVTVIDSYSSAGIPGATVTVNDITATTGYDGSVTIETAAGTYTATASASGYKGGSTSVTVTAGTTNSANLALTPESAPNGKAIVKVTDTYSNAGIPGAMVTVNGITATTGYDGSATIETAAGTYTATASASGYKAGSTSVIVTPGKEVTSTLSLTPESTPNGKIVVMVTDTSSPSRTVPGATVTVNGITATTGYDGKATIETAAGTYTVIASASGYKAGSTSVIVTPGKEVTSTLPLKPVNANETSSTTTPTIEIELDENNPIVARAINETIKSIPGFYLIEAIVVLILLEIGKLKKR